MSYLFRKRKMIALFLSMILVLQMFLQAMPVLTYAAVKHEEQDVNLTDVLNAEQAAVVDTLNLRATRIEEDASYQTVFQLTSTLKSDVLTDKLDAIMAKIQSSIDMNASTTDAFKNDVKAYGGSYDTQTAYISKLLSNLDQTGESGSTLISTQDLKAITPELTFQIKLDNSYEVDATENYTLGTKKDLYVTGVASPVAWYCVKQVTTDGQPAYKTFDFGFYHNVYMLQDVTMGFHIAMQLNLGRIAGRTPEPKWNAAEHKMEYSYCNEKGEISETEPQYQISKTAPEEVNTNYIDYVISASTNAYGSLKSAIIKDKIPVGYEVSNVWKGDAPDADKVVGTDAYQVSEDNTTLSIQLPADISTGRVSSETYCVRMQMTQATYRSVLDAAATGGVYTESVTNTAELWNENETKKLADGASTTTDVTLQAFHKDGQVDEYDGQKINWTLQLNLSGRTNDTFTAYVVDSLDKTQHMYAESGSNYEPITIQHGASTDTYQVREITDASADYFKTYDQLSGEQTDASIRSILERATGDAVIDQQTCYLYQIEIRQY